MPDLQGESPGRMPRWFYRKVEAGPTLCKVSRILEEENLNTVCTGARCPNRGECYSSGTATFMIMGNRCTRNCAFCAVPSGNVPVLNAEEPGAVARAAFKLGLEHVVITSVTRDDLEDGGAGHFVETVEAVRELLPDAVIEILIPDFAGSMVAVERVLSSSPDILNHNVETVKRLYPDIRPQADYFRSLELILFAAQRGVVTKSGFMVGLGETASEITELMMDLRASGCQLLTVGQYLRPGSQNTPVARYYDPEEFKGLEQEALRVGFKGVASGPLVRSSYRARSIFENARGKAASGL